jgi:Cytochrome c7 and related cytochrome c/Cytochrome c554 and c-prime
VLCALTGGIVMLRLQHPMPAESQIHDRPIQVAGDGYVSSDTCKACHPSQYESWRGSFHRTMTQVATLDTVRANFDRTSVSEVPGNLIHLERRGSDLWAEFNDPDSAAAAADHPARIQRQIVMTTGSHAQQVYWYRTGRTRVLGQLPAMYLIAERRWIPRAAAFMRPPGDGVFSETGRWNGVCINCHATHGKWMFGGGAVPPRLSDAALAETTAAEFGIACEACHGPAAEHIRRNQNPVRRYALHLTGKPDPSIVQPAHLDAIRTSQVCGQCHGVWNYYEREDEQRANITGLPYRPGDELRKTRFVAEPPDNLGSPAAAQVLARDPGLVRESFWSDGMIRVSGREYNGLIESPCFKDAADSKKMSCSSCHTMHKSLGDARSIGVWADTHQVSAGMDGNEACLQCHEPLRANPSAHTRHQANSSGSACQNCHMPYTTYGLLRALRSHQISSPTVLASVQTGRPNACNLCHLDKTLEWTSNYLEKWYEAPKVPLSHDEETIAASLLWLLKGDAGQRALVAWSMGWTPAQQASGTNWTPPYLSGLLDDPYDAVRYIAYRSLRSVPGLGGVTYDFIAPSERRLADVAKALSLWQSMRRPSEIRADPALLFERDGSLNAERVKQLVRDRDNRRVSLRE